MTKKSEAVNLTESLGELATIVAWFEQQSSIDVETGLEQVRAAAKLIAASKTRLAEIENEFHELEKEMGGSSDEK